MRKLILRKEVLRELDGTRLRKAGGGGTQTTPIVRTLPIQYCLIIRTTAVDCPF